MEPAMASEVEAGHLEMKKGFHQEASLTSAQRRLVIGQRPQELGSGKTHLRLKRKASLPLSKAKALGQATKIAKAKDKAQAAGVKGKTVGAFKTSKMASVK